MITAVDTSVLLDVLLPDPTYGPRSADALREAIATGSLIACEVVWAEIGAQFADPADAARALDRLTVSFSALDSAAALDAGIMWAAYRRRGGRRTRVIADFLIAAHARGQAERLLTRDRGFFRTSASDLALVDPSAG